MNYEIFFAGMSGTVLGTVLGALVGAWISARLTFGFQKLLLQQQIEFQKAQAELDAAFRKQAHEDHMALINQFSTTMDIRLGNLPTRSPFGER